MNFQRLQITFTIRSKQKFGARKTFTLVGFYFKAA